MVSINFKQRTLPGNTKLIETLMQVLLLKSVALSLTNIKKNCIISMFGREIIDHLS